MRFFLSTIFLFSILIIPSLKAEKSGNNFDDLKILFIGNSRTSYNDMPEMFKQLAIASGRDVRVGKAFHPGKALYELRYNVDVHDSINAEQWDYVVLQSSAYYAFEELYDLEKMTLSQFREMILENCPTSKIIYPMMWAVRDGFSYEVDGQTYTVSYEDFHNLIYEMIFPFMYDNEPLIIAPVATTWNSVIEDDNEAKFDLYSKDKSHPAWNGSYLMACVMHSTVYFENESNIDYFAELNPDTAYYYQERARSIVLNDLSLWNINYDYTSIEDVVGEKYNFELYQNTPNPFSTFTNISFEIKDSGAVKLLLLDNNGRLLKVLIDEQLNQGVHNVDLYKEGLPAGIYYYQLIYDHKMLVKKMIVH